MLKRLLFVVAIGTGMAACNTATHSHDGHDHDHGDAPTDAGDGKHFGDVITDEGSISFDDLLEKMKSVDSLDTKFTGTVSAVCQTKGCWMNVKSADTGEEIFVQFKDYGFFMPKDIAGRQVVMDGYAYRAVTSVEELRHFAEDEGKSPEEIAKITEPIEELKFMASGVLLLDPESKQ